MNKQVCLSLINNCNLSYEKQLDLIKCAGFDGYYLEWAEGIDVNKIKAYGDSIGLTCAKMNAPVEIMGDVWKNDKTGRTALEKLLACAEVCGENHIPKLVVRCCYGNEIKDVTEFGIKNFTELHAKTQEHHINIELEYSEDMRHMDTLFVHFKNFKGVGHNWNMMTELEQGHGDGDTILHGARIESVFLGDSTQLQDIEYTMKRLNRYGYDDILAFKMYEDVSEVSEQEFLQLLHKQYQAAIKIAEIKANAVQVNIDDELAPAVFAVEHDYHIMMYPSQQCLMWVKVGDKVYYDEKNGILRSHTTVHKVVVPMEELDKAEKYTLCLRYTVNRMPYFPEIEPVQEKTFSFSSLKGKEKIRAYHLADTHVWVKGPVVAAKTYGDIDFLILNGDIVSHNDCEEDCKVVYELISALTGGNIPTVFARGNHDLRGLLAERYCDNTPTANGNSYYTFRMGEIWGIILDVGEDKWDDHVEYGGTVCCHQFRLRETEFIENVITRADEEYLAEGVKYRLVFSHCPITIKQEPLFDIEDDILRKWSKLLKEYIHPDLMLAGHHHKIELVYPGEPRDYRNQACPLLIANTKIEEEYYVGTGLEFNCGSIMLTYTDNHGAVVGEKLL